MTATDQSAATTADHAARWISIAFHPLCQIYAVLMAVGSSHGWRGLGLALLAATLIAGIPGLALWRSVRTGRVSDMDVSHRHQRPLVLSLSLLSVVVAVLTLVALHAPPSLLALLAAMAAGVTVSAGVSTLWKASIHAGCTAGAAAVLGLALTWWATLALAPAVLAVSWARVHTGAHTPAQVVTGAAIGACIATVVYAALR